MFLFDPIFIFDQLFLFIELNECNSGNIGSSSLKITSVLAIIIYVLRVGLIAGK